MEREVIVPLQFKLNRANTSPLQTKREEQASILAMQVRIKDEIAKQLETEAKEIQKAKNAEIDGISIFLVVKHQESNALPFPFFFQPCKNF